MARYRSGRENTAAMVNFIQSALISFCFCVRFSSAVSALSNSRGVYPAFLMVSRMAESFADCGAYAITAFSVAKLTDTFDTPSSFPIAFSTRRAQAAQVMPPIGIVILVSAGFSSTSYPIFTTASFIADSCKLLSSYSTNNFSLARFTDACRIPGSVLTFFSIRWAQTAQVMPRMPITLLSMYDYP